MTVLGAPGIGKSRLLREAVASIGEPRAGRGRPLPALRRGITYWPLVEIVRQVAGQEPRSTTRELLAADENAELAADYGRGRYRRLGERGGSTDETHWAIRTLLEAMARDRPLVVVLEDLHWAEPRSSTSSSTSSASAGREADPVPVQRAAGAA